MSIRDWKKMPPRTVSGADSRMRTDGEAATESRRLLAEEADQRGQRDQREYGHDRPSGPQADELTAIVTRDLREQLSHAQPFCPRSSGRKQLQRMSGERVAALRIALRNRAECQLGHASCERSIGEGYGDLHGRTWPTRWRTFGFEQRTGLTRRQRRVSGGRGERSREVRHESSRSRPEFQRTAPRLRTSPPLTEVRRLLARYRGAAPEASPRVAPWRGVRSPPAGRDQGSR